jgi:hypothetical protein
MASCFYRATDMSNESFQSITMGTPISQVVDKVGDPYSIHTISPGVQEYEYIEKIMAAGQFVAENHYFLRVSDDLVTGKRMTRERSPAYDLIYQEDYNYPTYPTIP